MGRGVYCEPLLGRRYKTVGEYLDECCLMNASTDDGCPGWQRCRRWWDEHCNGVGSDLTEAKMKAIIEEFDEAREKWLKEPLFASSRRRLLPASRDRATGFA